MYRSIKLVSFVLCDFNAPDVILIPGISRTFFNFFSKFESNDNIYFLPLLESIVNIIYISFNIKQLANKLFQELQVFIDS